MEVIVIITTGSYLQYAPLLPLQNASGPVNIQLVCDRQLIGQKFTFVYIETASQYLGVLFALLGTVVSIASNGGRFLNWFKKLCKDSDTSTNAATSDQQQHFRIRNKGSVDIGPDEDTDKLKRLYAAEMLSKRGSVGDGGTADFESIEEIGVEPRNKGKLKHRPAVTPADDDIEMAEVYIYNPSPGV
jgi:hypothetical protein